MSGTLCNCVYCGNPMVCGPNSHNICGSCYSGVQPAMVGPLREFFAWLEGFEETFTGTYGSGHPNKDQWDKIRRKLDGVRDPFPHLRAALNDAPSPSATPFILPDLRSRTVPPTYTTANADEGKANE